MFYVFFFIGLDPNLDVENFFKCTLNRVVFKKTFFHVIFAVEMFYAWIHLSLGVDFTA